MKIWPFGRKQPKPQETQTMAENKGRYKVGGALGAKPKVAEQAVPAPDTVEFKALAAEVKALAVSASDGMTSVKELAEAAGVTAAEAKAAIGSVTDAIQAAEANAAGAIKTATETAKKMGADLEAVKALKSAAPFEAIEQDGFPVVVFPLPDGREIVLAANEEGIAHLDIYE